VPKEEPGVCRAITLRLLDKLECRFGSQGINRHERPSHVTRPSDMADRDGSRGIYAAGVSVEAGSMACKSKYGVQPFVSHLDRNPAFRKPATPRYLPQRDPPYAAVMLNMAESVDGFPGTP